MSWNFEMALAVLFAMIFVAQIGVKASRLYVPLPFTLGILSLLGYRLGLFPENLTSMAQLKFVGFIAFTLLVVHSGTILVVSELRRHLPVAIFLCGLALVLMVSSVGVSFALWSVDVGIIGFSPIFGGGAVAAIASISVMASHPELAMLPWVIFMLQGLIIHPLFKWSSGWMISQENEYQDEVGGIDEGVADESGYKKMFKGLQKVPGYSLFVISLMAFFVKFVLNSIGNGLPHVSMFMLLLGVFLGHFGVLEREPLNHSSTMGLLMPGLMALMIDGFSGVEVVVFLGLMVKAFVLLSLGVFAAMSYAWIVGPKFFKHRREAYVCVMTSMVGYAPIEFVLNHFKIRSAPSVIMANKWMVSGIGIICAAMVRVLV